MAEHRISKRYARAIMQAAKEAGSIDVVTSDLKEVQRTIESSRDFEIYLKSPVIRSLDKKKAIKEIFDGKLNELTDSFLQLLAHKGRENFIPSIVAEYITIYNQQHNILPIKVTTAVEIDEPAKQNILNEVKERTGMNLEGEFTVDPAIKGGVVIRMDDMVIDSSLRNKLNDLYKRLATGDAA